MSAILDATVTLRDVGQGMAHASDLMRQATDRIYVLERRNHELESALGRMVQAHLDTESDSEGRYPAPNAGCIECTCGTVPNRLNTGLCAFHNAKHVLGLS